MANKIYLNSTFGYREDTLKNWQTANPVLERGELSFVRDGYDGKFVKIGDGHTTWNSLPFAPLPKGENGKDYILSDADKAKIADMAKPVIDHTYNPESENAQSGVAVAEALEPFNRKYELIETITISEEVNTITRNTEPNGNAYSFKDVLIKFTWNNTFTTRSLIFVAYTSDTACNVFRDVSSTNANATSWIRTLNTYGERLVIFSGVSSNDGFAQPNSAVNIPIRTINSAEPIEKIGLQMFNSVFPTDAKIEIWGVRA